MARAIIAGGSIAGLATGLFLARRGHGVRLVEPDAEPPQGDADQVVDGWAHRGAPQARQPHNLLARGSRVLAEEVPELVEALIDNGVIRAPLGVMGTVLLEEEDFGLLARRLVLEAQLRRACVEQPAVELSRDTVAGLRAEQGDAGRPIVVGIETESGARHSADLVVDATGRRSPARRWLAELGVEMPEPHEQTCGYRYISRYYRLRPSQKFPRLDVPIMSDLGYMMAAAFPADNGAYALLLIAYHDDPLCKQLMRESGFEAAVRAIPLTAEWRCLGDPIADVSTLAKIENRWSRLLVEDEPIVGGFVLVGDSAMHTNPTMARGASLALAQAQRLAQTVEEAVADPVRFVGAFEAWTAENLGVWFDSQVANDRNTLEKFARALAGEAPKAPDDPIGRFIAGLGAVSQEDTEVARVLSRVTNLLMTPTELMDDAHVVGAVTRFLRSKPDLTPVFDPPPRSEFEAALA